MLTKFAAFMSQTYYNNFCLLELLWWNCWISITPIKINVNVIGRNNGCANPCLQLIAIAASTEVYSFNSELNRAQTSNLNLNQTGTGNSESSYSPKGENCPPPLAPCTSCNPLTKNTQTSCKRTVSLLLLRLAACVHNCRSIRRCIFLFLNVAPSKILHVGNSVQYWLKPMCKNIDQTNWP